MTSRKLAAAVIVAVAAVPSGSTADLIWAPVLGRPLLAWSVEPLLRVGEVALERRAADDPAGIVIGQLLLVVAPERLADAETLCAREGWSRAPRRVFVVPGGPRRRDAVRAGLMALPPLSSPPLGERPGEGAVATSGQPRTEQAITVILHDAARPLVTPALVEAALRASQRGSAATAVEPVKETLKLVREGHVAATLPRERLARAQMPQVFHLDALLAAYDACDAAFDPPDEAALALAAGLPLATFPGSPENLKVRTAADLAAVERLLRARQGG